MEGILNLNFIIVYETAIHNQDVKRESKWSLICWLLSMESFSQGYSKCLPWLLSLQK